MNSLDSSMTSTLLSLSLFQGLTKEELMDILSKTRIEFVGKENELVFRQGDKHEQVTFVINGTILREHTGTDGCYTFRETMAGDIVEPASLFGRDTTFRASYRAAGSVTLMCFDKHNLFNVLNHFPIVQLNILNALCATIHTLQGKALIPSKRSIGNSFYRLMAQLSTHPDGEKTMDISRVELARLLGCSRRAMSDLMAKWDKQGLIRIGYRQFTVPRIGNLKHAAEE